MLLEALSIGTSLLGGLMQSNAANKAADAQATAQQNALHASQRATQQAQQFYEPGVAAYGAGVNALAQRLGLPGAVANGGKQAKGGAFDPAAYLKANPDVAAEYARLSPNNLKNNLGVSTPEQFAQWHYNQYGQYENRAGSPSELIDTPQAAAPAATQTPTNAMNGVFGNTADPKWTPPPEFSFSVDSFKSNPAYQFALDQGSGQVTANAAATGALQSGAALKALQDRGQKTAYQWYSSERDSAFDRYNSNRLFDRSTYESDRNYLTGRYDRSTDDLFRLTSLGQNAANSSANAALGQGAAESNALTNIGNSTAGNALAQGNIWSGVLGDAAGVAKGVLNKGNALSSWMKGAGSANPWLF